jgi:hypothetical protein
MPNWTVYLIGGKTDLRTMAAVDPAITQEGDHFVFRAQEIDSIEDAEVVKAFVTERLAIVRGFVRVRIGDRDPHEVRVGAIKDPARGQTVVLGVIDEDLPVGILGDWAAWLPAALRDPDTVGWALKLFGEEPTPATLNKVLEVIKRDMGGRMVEPLKWTTGTKISNFTGTVHSFHHLGAQARHAVQDGDPMADDRVLSGLKMREFIRDLLVKWLDHKCQGDASRARDAEAPDLTRDASGAY